VFTSVRYFISWNTKLTTPTVRKSTYYLVLLYKWVMPWTPYSAQFIVGNQKLKVARWSPEIEVVKTSNFLFESTNLLFVFGITNNFQSNWINLLSLESSGIYSRVATLNHADVSE
jgi:hypothetical protein